MFCKYCGAENNDGAAFCKSCGKPLGNAPEPMKTEAPTQGTTNVNPGTPADGNKPKSFPTSVIIIAAVVVVALISIITISVKSSSTINLNKYLTIDTKGYDGYGTATARIDWDAIEDKYGDKISFKSKAKSEYGGFLTYMTPIDILKENVNLYIDINKNLSNNEQILYSWDVNDDLSEYINCKVKYENGSEVVSGLKEVGTFDAFADLTVEFSGISPNGKANLNYTGSKIDSYDFSCDKTKGLSNGDQVVVTIDDRNIQYYAENLGEVPAELEKVYTVEGLDNYVQNPSEIDAASLDAMKQQGEDVLNAHIAKSWGDYEFLQGITYIGNYLLTAKDPASANYNNRIFLVYKVQVRNTYSNNKQSYDKENSFYWYISYKDLLVKTNNSIDVDLSDYSTPQEKFTIDSGVSQFWSNFTWYYYGYQTIDELYKYAVTQYLDKYNHQDSIDENVVPEAVSEETTSAADGDYKLPKSGTELISAADLEGFTADDCAIALNEIYARHGRKFKDATLQSYFDGKEWYEGTIEPDAFKESDLSEIEIANRDAIVQYEKDKGYR